MPELSSAVTRGGFGSATRPKTADAAFGPSMPSAQLGFFPVHAPLQRTNVHPFCGVASNRALTPARKVPEHLPGQAMPTGELFTDPRPTFVTARG